MAEELTMKDLQMKGLAEKITEMFEKLNRSKRKELDLAEIYGRIKEFQLAYDSSNIELRHIGNHPNKTEFKQQLREHKTILREIKQLYDEKKAVIIKDDLFADGEDEGVDRETAEGLMKHGLDTQAKSKESLQRTLGVIDRTKEVGIDTVLKLEANTKQTEGLYDSLEQIESSLQRSTKIIRRIARKMATDKYIWVMIILIACAVIVILVLKNVPAKSSTSTSSAGSTAGSI